MLSKLSSISHRTLSSVAMSTVRILNIIYCDYMGIIMYLFQRRGLVLGIYSNNNKDGATACEKKDESCQMMVAEDFTNSASFYNKSIDGELMNKLNW